MIFLTPPMRLLFLIAIISGAVFAQDAGNPQPSPDDLLLPLPGGISLAFRPVGIGPDTGPFTARLFKVGDRVQGVQGYQEFPTDVTVGGTVSMTLDGEKQWVYFFGKYEVSEAQWQAIMGSDPAKNGNLPMRNVSWLEVQEFIHKLNTHLLSSARDKLPKNEGQPLFVRLPTEAEWEFAARGGLKVSDNDRDRRHPYTQGPLTDYEWFSGPQSSNDKVKPIGKKKPNPLGLHDMLGNVAEFTSTLYAIEYYQGRVGDATIRGGDFYSDQEDLRSSLRNEFPLYNAEQDYQPRRSGQVGLRLALASPITVNAFKGKEMEAAWEKYRLNRNVPSIVSGDAPNRSAQVAGRITQLNDFLSRLKTSLDQNNVAEAQATLGLAMSNAQNITADANAVEGLLAKTLVEAAFRYGASWGEALVRAKVNRESQDDLKLAIEYRDQARTEVSLAEADIAIVGPKYGEVIRRMGNTNPAMLESALEDFIQLEVKRDSSQKSAGQLELQVLKAIRKHITKYRQNPRFDADACKADFLNIFYTPE